eukprot:m.106918 g.106918  ORF g.106918 m.106918 type:complete len:349 (-) comp13904_c0_seq1:5961-7007(-)
MSLNGLVALAALLFISSPSLVFSLEDSEKTIWTWFNYPKGGGPLVELNIRTWRKHNPDYQVILVNNSNVMKYVPDMPDEFFRLPYDQCKSDVIRAGIIYHNGGLYMDTDFLMMKPIDDVMAKLETYEIISYADHGATEQTECGGQFSSNWHGGKRHNTFSTVWWENMKHRLTRKCKPGDFVGNVEKVCCHEEDAPEKENDKCHVPWAQLEHLKQPESWKNRHKDDEPPISYWPSDIKLFCLYGSNTLTPHLHGEIYWQPWNASTQKTGTGHWELPKFKFECKEDDNGAMDCGRKGKIENFFGRVAYHLFFSTFNSGKVKTAKEVLHRPWLISEMYRRSLGLVRKKKRT